MNATIAVWQERFDERSLRERLLISAAILAFTWVLWDVSLGSVVTSHKNEVATAVEQLTRELQLQTNERDRLLAEDTAPQKTALEQQQTRL